MWYRPRPICETSSHRFDFVIVDNGRQPIKADKTRNAWISQNILMLQQPNVKEHITREKWKTKSYRPILPVANRLVKWQEVLKACSSKSRDYCFFMVRARRHGVPLWKVARCFTPDARRTLNYCCCAHAYTLPDLFTGSVKASPRHLHGYCDLTHMLCFTYNLRNPKSSGPETRSSIPHPKHCYSAIRDSADLMTCRSHSATALSNVGRSTPRPQTLFAHPMNSSRARRSG